MRADPDGDGEARRERCGRTEQRERLALECIRRTTALEQRARDAHHVATGARTEMPSTFPWSSGRTSPIAFAAPVDVGIRFTAAARARRRSLCGKSRITWSFVYAWIVVMKPDSIPPRSSITFASGATQFVVHEAFETMWCRELS